MITININHRKVDGFYHIYDINTDSQSISIFLTCRHSWSPTVYRSLSFTSVDTHIDVVKAIAIVAFLVWTALKSYS